MKSGYGVEENTRGQLKGASSAETELVPCCLAKF